MYSREALQLREKLLGVHQDTAHSHVDLSDVLVMKRAFESALKEIEEALIIQKDVLGELHDSTISTQAKRNEILLMEQSLN